ncbi:MAG: hypothetical protein JRI23_10270, partial [Deltaproteobacteria bacterium]|nr:hypothetical protein [Deltaproteobacteria bacterium]MBW2532053.1 hypothetical protein [Deltaproteobacteria bacterium]
MPRRLLVAVALVVSLLGSAAKAEAQVIEGNPFVEPVRLAGTWRYIDQDLSPEEAAAADLSSWAAMEIPGRRRSEGAGTIGWYGIDVKLPPRAEWPEPPPELVLSPPFFLFAYEVYVGERLIGSSGALPPQPRWGPLRQRLFTIPRDAAIDRSPLALRLRVWASSVPFRGTGLRCRSAAILLGTPQRVIPLVELANEKERSAWPWQTYLTAFHGTLALVFAIFWLLTRRDRAHMWLTATLVCVAIAAALNVDAGLHDDPQQVLSVENLLGSVALATGLMCVRAVLDLDSRLAKGLTWLAGAHVLWCGFTLGARQVTSVKLVTVGATVAVGGYVLVATIRRAGQRHPDARLLALGVGVLGASLVLTPILGVLTSLGHLPWRRAVLLPVVPDFGLAALALTMSIVIARRYARSFGDLEASFAASRRFVPERFLSLLGRKEITEVERADATEQKMAIVFADIRGFTTRSEAAGAEATFELVNRYLETIEPAIHEHEGFINKFLGDG